jgi:hypothetical protein
MIRGGLVVPLWMYKAVRDSIFSGAVIAGLYVKLLHFLPFLSLSFDEEPIKARGLNGLSNLFNVIYTPSQGS